MPLEKTWTERFEEKCQAETNHYKNEVLNLVGFSLSFTLLGQPLQYTAVSAGTNA